jgi:hypothetical protein
MTRPNVVHVDVYPPPGWEVYGFGPQPYVCAIGPQGVWIDSDAERCQSAKDDAACENEAVAAIFGHVPRPHSRPVHLVGDETSRLFFEVVKDLATEVSGRSCDRETRVRYLQGNPDAWIVLDILANRLPDFMSYLTDPNAGAIDRGSQQVVAITRDSDHFSCVVGGHSGAIWIGVIKVCVDTGIAAVRLEHRASRLIKARARFAAVGVPRRLKTCLSERFDLGGIAEPVPEPVSASLNAGSPESPLLRCLSYSPGDHVPDGLTDYVRLLRTTKSGAPIVGVFRYAHTVGASVVDEDSASER